MELTLRKANAVQTQINDVLKNIHFSPLVEINEFEDAEQTIKQAADTFSENIKRRERLLEALYAIRKSVGTANQTSGLNTLLADSAHLEKQIKFYTDLMDNKPRLTKEVIEGKLNRLRTTESATRMYREQGISTTMFVQQDLANFKSVVMGCRKTRQKVQDQILELNVKTAITITSEVEKTLKDEGII